MSRYALAVLLGLAVALAIRVSEDPDWRELAQDAALQIGAATL